MIKHSTVKPYECEVCKKRFKHKKSYEKHMALGKHKKTETEHDCDFCDESFPTRDLLVDHFAEVHHEENIINNISECVGMADQNDEEEVTNGEENNARIKVEKSGNVDGIVQVKSEPADN